MTSPAAFHGARGLLLRPREALQRPWALSECGAAFEAARVGSWLVYSCSEGAGKEGGARGELGGCYRPPGLLCGDGGGSDNRACGASGTRLVSEASLRHPKAEPWLLTPSDPVSCFFKKARQQMEPVRKRIPGRKASRVALDGPGLGAWCRGALRTWERLGGLHADPCPERSRGAAPAGRSAHPTGCPRGIGAAAPNRSRRAGRGRCQLLARSSRASVHGPARPLLPQEGRRGGAQDPAHKGDPRRNAGSWSPGHHQQHGPGRWLLTSRRWLCAHSGLRAAAGSKVTDESILSTFIAQGVGGPSRLPGPRQHKEHSVSFGPILRGSRCPLSRDRAVEREADKGLSPRPPPQGDAGCRSGNT